MPIMLTEDLQKSKTTGKHYVGGTGTDLGYGESGALQILVLHKNSHNDLARLS